ncbi:hypothetical protein [Novosphingobium humi]|uniref:Uncharacterized protein n=1 Tax=Novosphingobium humi TaxID=2282397 RepID=A0ABY7TYA7_9SPHN|nr:hypothetical protein [Novosphingobium humi]WCT77592.1 hypothetical protein PQ457_01010 [Novosphingobium humi]
MAKALIKPWTTPHSANRNGRAKHRHGRLCEPTCHGRPIRRWGRIGL